MLHKVVVDNNLSIPETRSSGILTFVNIEKSFSGLIYHVDYVVLLFLKFTLDKIYKNNHKINNASY